MNRRGDTLPEGLLVAWYGDDFTGSSAVMEVLTAAGLPSVLFLAPPTAEQLAKFPDIRAVGIAGIARSKPPDWMEEHLPAIFRTLAAFEPAIVHYKICSTFDSAPTIGSIGKAIDMGAPIVRSDWIPLLPAAPQISRFQAFANLFATVEGKGIRLDRHPTMRRHPTTPMDEADIRLHLARQTPRKSGLVDFVAMKAGDASKVLARERADGCEIVALDVVDEETLRESGRLTWADRAGPRLVVGSQGVEYALVAHWRTEGLIASQSDPGDAGPAERMMVVSGSCAPDTARQIAWAGERGFAPIRVDIVRALDADAWKGEIESAVGAALSALGAGKDPILYTASGPDDEAINIFNQALEASGHPPHEVNERVGAGLGAMLDRVLRATDVKRCVIAGGDTSGRGALALDLFALTAIACATPGAPLCLAHSNDPAFDHLEIALKGGQMGAPDYFATIKRGGRAA